ncbi:hypothetical protein [Streptacidiphilus neutrinimicus]|uniref:hypothetical protein n=1 Tax=Streptacidiphilus neutrinimicus TaxID=105420 RepID=UPI0005A68575|nr:hypothetical protein [Streptacidiphilus neutrinimicus]
MATTTTDQCLARLLRIEGAIGAALVDYHSGLALGVAGGGPHFDLQAAAAGNTDVVRAKMRTMEMLRLDGEIDDILITLTGQYHLIRPTTAPGADGLYFYLALDRQKANLAMARRTLQQAEKTLREV